MLRRLLFCTALTLSSASLFAQIPAAPPAPGPAVGPAFWQEQLLFPRVRDAKATTGPRVDARLRAKHLNPQRLEIFLRLIKTQSELEVWARNMGGGPFELLHSYELAGTSGTLGPKRKSGDYQVPEGFYEIDRFNPKSNYHLSLGLNYPNEADRALGEPNPGGDIFIHGSNVTVGCLPITDAGIEEVYLLAVMARASGQAVIPVHIFPFPLTPAEFAKRSMSPHYAFWKGLQKGYQHFETTHDLPPPPTIAQK
ncbi:hypothetical protein GCM10023185_30410 [Hymenobacter saemangeumensis]|uniref:L,D-TPase catalytic domain-containing protein n=1 Tax=Hymenobacter saemangeumensis TaxID=1084522 RepID=A0ABP8ILH9_9BACT